YSGPQYRWINAIKFWTTPPGGSTRYIPIWGPWPYPQTDYQSHDTRNPESGMGTQYTYLNNQGAYLFSFQTNVYATGYQIPTRPNLVTRWINSLACEPKFNYDPYNNIAHVPVTSPISVYVPDTMSDLFGPIDNAITDWNSALTGTGLSFARTTSACVSG